MLRLVVFAAAFLGTLLLSHRIVVGRVGSDYANRQWKKAAVAGIVGLATAILARHFVGSVSLGNVELPLLILGTGLEVGALARRRWNRGRFGSPVVNMAGNPIQKLFRIAGVMMLGGGMLMLAGALVGGQPGTVEVLRLVFFGATGLLLLAKSQPTPELFENGIVRLEGTLPWDRVSAYAWQEYEKVSVLRLQLREAWRFQRRLSFTIPTSEQATVHAWLQKRIPYLGSQRKMPERKARLPV